MQLKQTLQLKKRVIMRKL
jgi:hypothetical protein